MTAAKIRYTARRRLVAMALLSALALGSGSFMASAQVPRSPASDDSRALSPRQAADKAKARHGGKVLKVQRKGRAYRVRLLLEDGRVITVTVKG